MDSFFLKTIVSIFMLLLFTSCSYLTPKSANEYTVTRKSPLVIPPDMNMMPPVNESKKNKNAMQKVTDNKDGLSVEEILTGQVVEKKIKMKKKKSKNSLNKKILVDKLIEMKASVILK